MAEAEEKNSLLGEKLKASRRQANFTLTKISELTGINIRYLEALEDGRYELLPPIAYVKGILKKYSRLFGLDEKELIALLEAEQQKEKTAGFKDVIPSLKSRGRFVFFGKINPKISWSSLTIGLLVFLVIAIFIGYQLKNFLAQPEINLLAPPEGFITATSSVDLEGYVRYARVLKINSRNVYFDDKGYFKETVNLTEGPNIIELEAVNLMGNKNSLLKRTVIYQK